MARITAIAVNGLKDAAGTLRMVKKDSKATQNSPRIPTYRIKLDTNLPDQPTNNAAIKSLIQKLLKKVPNDYSVHPRKFQVYVAMVDGTDSMTILFRVTDQGHKRTIIYTDPTHGGDVVIEFTRAKGNMQFRLIVDGELLHSFEVKGYVRPGAKQLRCFLKGLIGTIGKVIFLFVVAAISWLFGHLDNFVINTILDYTITLIMNLFERTIDGCVDCSVFFCQVIARSYHGTAPVRNAVGNGYRAVGDRCNTIWVGTSDMFRAGARASVIPLGASLVEYILYPCGILATIVVAVALILVVFPVYDYLDHLGVVQNWVTAHREFDEHQRIDSVNATVEDEAVEDEAVEDEAVEDEGEANGFQLNL